MKRCAPTIESLEHRRLLSLVGPKFPLANTASEEGAFNIATDGSNFAAGMIKDGIIGAETFAADGTILSPFATTGRPGLNTASGDGGIPMIAFGNGQYLLAWGDSGSPATPTHDIWGAFFTGTGALSGAPFPISRGNIEEKMMGIAFDGTQFLVTYQGDLATGTRVFGRFVSPAAVVGAQINISTNFGSEGLNNLAYGVNHYLAVWVDDVNRTDVRGRFIDPDGTLGTEFSINGTASISDDPCSVAFNGGTFLVTFADQVGGPDEFDLFAQGISQGGTIMGPPVAITSAPGLQFLPFISTNGSEWLVTWTDARKDTNNNSVNDPGEGSFVDIYGQYLDFSGNLLGGGFAINKDPGYQLGGASAFAFASNSFVVSWNDGVTYTDDQGPSAFGDVFAAPVSLPVLVFNSGGDLNILGTDLPDNISLTLLPNFDIRFDDGNGNTQDFNVDSIQNITIYGNDGADMITITGQIGSPTYVDGGMGDDSITTSEGDDTLTGGAGKDTLDGGIGNDRVNGNSGDDILRGGSDADRLFGGDGNDILDGGDGTIGERGADTDELNGGKGLDTADYSNHPLGVSITLDNIANDGYGSPNPEFDNVINDIETVLGGAGNDQLRGSAGDNLLQGGGGNDLVRAGFDDLDTLATNSGDGNDTLEGGKGDDFIDAAGAGGNKTFIAGAGSDRIKPGTGDDIVNGGADIDTIDYSSRGQNLKLILAEPTIASTGNGQKGESDTLIDIENALGGSKDDVLTGNSLPNQLDGQKGNDTLTGNAGDDVLSGGVGDDSMLGGDGNDVFLNDNAATAPATDVDFMDGQAGFDIGEFDTRDTLFAELDVGRPSAASNPFPPLNAAAVEVPKTPVLAKNGKLTVFGTSTRDIINVDMVGDSIRVGISKKLSAIKFPLSKVKRIEINGGAGNDSITAKLTLVKFYAPSVVFIGGDGNDTMTGGDQPDQFVCGPTNDGQDNMIGGGGSNSVLYDQRTSAVKISNDNVKNDGAPGEGDNVHSDITNLFGGFANDTITGGASAEFLFGGDGADKLDGAAGSDKLVGGSGIDTALSGTGVDLTVLRGDGYNDFYNLGPKKDGLSGGFYSIDSGDVSI